MKTGFLKTSAIYGGLSVLSRFSALFTAPILTSILSVGEYGVVDTLNASLAIASLLVGMNLDSGVFRLYYEKKEEDRGSLLLTSLFVYLFFSGLITLFIAMQSSRVSGWIWRRSSRKATRNWSRCCTSWPKRLASGR